MTLARLGRLLHRLPTGPPEEGDGDLLARFAAARDEFAFSELVRRHGPMVLGVCSRVLGHHHDAQDAFQATFLVLAQRAGGICLRQSVGDWLHGVARRTALAARREAARRRRHESMAPPRTDPAPADTDLRAALDDELARLPARYREVLVLSDLEGKERRRVAAELGIPEGTAASRLGRARRLLAARLSRRGWGPAGGLAAVVLPAGTEAAVARAAVQLAAGVTGAGPGVLLAERVVRAMTWKKVVAAVAGVGLAVGAGVAGLSAAGESGGTNPAPRPSGYSVSAAGGSAVLLDTASGDAWVLNQPPGGEPAWVPVKRPARQPETARPAPARGAAPAGDATPAAPPKPKEPASFEVPGRLVLSADRTFRVHPRVGGVVAKVVVRVGQTMKAGDPLAVLDDTEAKLAVEAAEADLLRARADLPDKRDPAVVSERELRRAEAAVRRAEVELRRARENLAGTRLSAPTDGVVMEVNTMPGDVVQPLGQSVFVVADPRALEAWADVPESDANTGLVVVGKRCSVRLMSAPGTRFRGEVARVAAVVDPSTGTMPVGVRLVLTSGAAPPRPGTAVTVRFLSD
jgi:RNA polymerase sigma-70 factor (ECF subfamily)